MKIDMSVRFMSIMFSFLLKDYLKKEKPELDRKKLIKATKKEYKEMISRTPGLSKDNQMAGNLKGAAYFFSMAKAIPNMTPEWMDEIIDYAFSMPLMVKVKSKDKKNGTLFKESEQEKMYKDSLRSQKSNDEMDWRYTYNKGCEHIQYNITKCGVCRLAQREDLMEYLPCMCRMDYPKYKLVGAKLTRTMTLAKGDSVCDFDLKKED